MGSHHTFCWDMFRAVSSVGFDTNHVDPSAEKGENDLKCAAFAGAGGRCRVGSSGLSAGWKSQNSFSSSKWRREESASICW